jgi:alkylhydroperoxidase family enzyme
VSPLRPIAEHEATLEQRELLREWAADRAQTTPPGVIWRFLMHSPQGMRQIGKLGAFVRVGTSLRPLLREAAVYITVCARQFDFEIAIHTRNMEALGVGADTLHALVDANYNALDDDVAVVARLAHALVGGGTIAARILDDARELLGDEGFVELAIVITYFHMMSDLNRSFPGAS